ncbi:hypothetical protein ANCDUO_15686 [Ancylostoma duodenale]|uniref:Uncharacterized protein n=1 Tax=Ancylostoma duodenale TaxID=51022 RepID=A0A0C2G5J0_9BILA|nr:hypothetical protein ANCDUO_15686 [Ancylostoma duodenale]
MRAILLLDNHHSERGFVDSAGNTAHKKSDVNSKEHVTIYPVYNAKYRYWQATYPHLLCTTRQKGRQSTHNSFQSVWKLCNSAQLIAPIHDRNPKKSRMHWEQFKHLYKQHFKVNAGVQRGLIDGDFELLKYKLQCPDCQSGEDGANIDGIQRGFPCTIGCENGRIEMVWRGMLELLQIFHDSRNNVRKLWEMGLLLGFLEFDEVDNLLEQHKSALIMRLSFVTGGTICFTVKSTAHTLDHRATRPIHLEPLDLKRLQTKCLKDYLRDIADAEKVSSE